MESQIKQFGQISTHLANSETFYLTILDRSGNCVFVNKLFEKHFGEANKRLVDTSFIKLLHHNDIGKCAELFGKIHDNSILIANVELRLWLPNKLNLVWVNWEFSVWTDEEGKILGIICIGSNIIRSESKINARLLSYSRRIDKILNSITDGFFTLDNNWRITKVNQLFQTLAGKSKSELLGKIFWEEYPEYTHFLKHPDYLKAVEKNEAFQIELFSEGKQEWFSIKIYPSSEGLTVFFQNITENKQQIEEIIYKNEILTEIARLQSHQIRRPVATMLGLSQLFDKTEMGEGNLELLDLLEKTILELDEVIHKIVHKANSVIKNSKTKSHS